MYESPRVITDGNYYKEQEKERKKNTVVICPLRGENGYCTSKCAFYENGRCLIRDALFKYLITKR